MVRIATKDTFGAEVLMDSGEPIEMRRRIMAGQQIPDHYVVEEGDFKESGVAPVVAPPALKTSSVEKGVASKQAPAKVSTKKRYGEPE